MKRLLVFLVLAMAVIILLQIGLGDVRYRRMADSAIRWLGAGLREKHLQPGKQSAA